MKKLLLSVALMVSLGLVGCNKEPEKKPETTTTESPAPTTANAPATASSLPATAPTYKVGVEGSGQPFTFKDETGKLTGFDVELLQAIGEKQGFKIETLADDWATVFKRLDDDSRDIIASGVTITPERQQSMDFSDSYMDSYTAFAFKDPTIKSYDDLKSKKIGVQKGSDYAEFFKKHVTNPDQVKEYPTTFLAYQAMTKGEVDAVADDVNMLNSQNVRLKAKDIQTLPVPNVKSDKFAFAIKKGRADLAQKVNAGLAQVKADGTYDKLYQKWFGVLPAVSPNTATATTTTVSTTTTTTKTS